MDGPHTSTALVRAERRAMVALISLFALVAQALFANLAMASTAPLMDSALCADVRFAPSSDGGGSIPSDHGCDHGLCAMSAMSITRVEFARPVIYAAPLALTQTHAEPPAPQARAPPRPPGQGPPLPNA